jgi:hypothetical protein
MMAAVAWLYAAMSGGLPGQPGHSPGHAMSRSAAIQMPGMDVSGSETAEPGWIIAVNWITAAGFASAAVYWLYRYLAQRKPGPALRTDHLAGLGLLCQVFMASGMAIMFGAMA